jgi:hypothetical protein
MLAWLRAVFCRHSDVLCIESDRLYVRCDVCGRETKGWNVELGVRR